MDGSAGPADPAVREAAEVVTIALSLVAPYVAEEMWERLGHAPSVANASWPTVDQSLLITESVTCVVQIQGKVRSGCRYLRRSARTSCALWLWPTNRWYAPWPAAMSPR